MSLILEALKKSESERRLGQAPGLLSPTPATGADRRSRMPLVLAVVAAGLLGMLGSWWWLSLPRGDVDAPVDASEPETELVSSTAREAAPAAAPQQVAPEAAPATTRPAASRVAAPTTPVRTAADPVPAATGALPLQKAVPATPPVPTVPAPVASAPAPAPAPVVTTPAPIRVAPAEQGEIAATGERLPELRELSPAERAALPPLKLSMHVFAEQPGERFVLLDGRRYGEGMAIADGLLLHEIRRDSVVLELNGRRFLLPRPG